MFSCVNNMEPEEDNPRKSVKELSKFYVGRVKKVDPNRSIKFEGDGLRNQTVDSEVTESDLTPRELPHLDGNYTLPRTSFINKAIRVDSNSEMRILLRNKAIKHLMSNESTSTNAQSSKLASTSNIPRIPYQLPSGNTDSTEFDLRDAEVGYAEVADVREDRAYAEYDQILFAGTNSVETQIPTSAADNSYDLVIRRDALMETPLSSKILCEKDHCDTSLEGDPIENLPPRDIAKRNSGTSLGTVKFPPSRENSYDVVLKADNPRGSPGLLSEKLKAQIEEKLKIEKSRMVSGAYNDKVTKAQSLIIQELIDGEQKYLERLRHVIDNYLIHFKDAQTSAHIEVVFENIEKLYEDVKDLLMEIKQYNSADDIAEAFINNMKIFDQYTVALGNKSLANQWFNTTFDQLIKKPGKYLLFLKDLQAELKKSHQLTEKVDEVIVLVEDRIREINTKLELDCIQCCPISLDKMGSFVMKGMFKTNLDNETAIFLFEGCIVFCLHSAESHDRYNYIGHIETSNLSLEYCESPTAFELSYLDKSRPISIKNDFEIHIEANTKETKHTWIREINKCLHKPQSLDSDEEYDELLRRYGQAKSYRTLGPRVESVDHDNSKPLYVDILDLSAEQNSLLRELIKIEDSYLKGLKKFINDFYTYPESVSSYKYLLVENVEDIYNESEKLYAKLLKCSSLESIAEAFFENEKVFDACAAYMKNKSAFDFVYAELKKVQQDSTDLENGKRWIDSLLNLLLKPAKYKTFLEKLHNLSTKNNQHCQLLNDSIKFINRKINEAVTQMNIDSIQRCPINLSEKGPLLKKGTFQIENKCECALFLFRDVIVFCLKDQSHPETYLYFDSINMDRLWVADSGYTTTFQLTSSHMSKVGKKIGYTFNMIASSVAVKQQWIDEIRKLTIPLHN